MIADNLPVLVIIVPLFIGIVLPVFARRLRLVEGMVVLAETLGLVGVGFLAYMVVTRKDAGWIYQMGGWPAPWGIELKANSLAVFFLAVVMVVSLPIALFTIGNLRQEVGGNKRTARFYTLFLLLVGSLAGMALTNDLFNTYVLVEVATLSCCGLVSSHGTPRAAEASFNYLILATLASSLGLIGIGFIYVITGHLNMGFASQGLQQIWQTKPHVVWIAVSFVLVGFALKSALFPLHIWLPDAHSSAPSPASAVLSGLAVKGYMICLLKFLFVVFGPELMKGFSVDRILVMAGMIAIICGSIMALPQNNLKRRLAFSTVAQVGYIYLGFGLMDENGLAGALFYLASHAAIKSALFLSAGAMISATGKKKIRELAGIGRKMPLTAAVFTAASLGLIGIPLFSGFIGKWYLIAGSLDSGNFLPTVIIIAGSVLCAAYLFPVIRVAWFESPQLAEQGNTAQTEQGNTLQAEQGNTAQQADQADPAAREESRSIALQDEKTYSGQQVQQAAAEQNVQEETAPGKQVKDPGAAQKLALILLTAVIFILGIMPGPFIALAKRAAAELLMLR